MKKPDECPKCGSSDIRTRCAPKRLRQYACGEEFGNCYWKSTPYVPKGEVETEKSLIVNNCGGFTYTLYDQYDCVAIYSRSFSSEQECLKEALADRNRLLGKSPGYDKVTIVLWPEFVTARGKVIG